MRGHFAHQRARLADVVAHAHVVVWGESYQQWRRRAMMLQQRQPRQLRSPAAAEAAKARKRDRDASFAKRKLWLCQPGVASRPTVSLPPLNICRYTYGRYTYRR